MKKLFPLLLFVLLAFAGCQPSGPVEYQMTDNPRNVASNAEKFVKQTVKRSSKYTDEDWQNAVKQFIAMTKNGFEQWPYMTKEEISSFDAARLKFMEAIHDNGSEEIAMQVKAAYGEIFNK